MQLPRIPASQVTFPPSLPITEKREALVAALQQHQVIIVAGETGSGKTTQLPKLCLAAGLGTRGQIGCTQPRRIAALSLSRRIAEELSVTWGDEVGCKIRFSDRSKRSTTIKVMTDGILLAEIRSDPLLSAYEVLIIDEAHERSLNIDFIIGYLTTLITKRPDLKVIITSATIDTTLFSKAFNNAPIFEVSGRLYPVEVRYAPTPPDDDESSYVDGTIEAVEVVRAESRDGDILIFMPTERDIRETCDRLTGRYTTSAQVLPLMGSLSAAEQERIFKPSSVQKIIVATNIAETSLTIPNIRYVIDTGLARISRYNARQRTKRLPIERIAQSSAQQRTGRAGRVREGVCIRLYDPEEFEQRPEYPDPEILRANLAEVILRMKAFQLGDIENFPFLNPPDPRAIKGGYTLLHELGALDENQSLTPLGAELARLPVDPTIARMLLQSRREHTVPEVLVIAAGLSVQDPRERPLEKREKADERHRSFAHPDSDFLSLLAIWSAYTAEWKRTKSQSQVRKFCAANFLSFMRMREWNDIVGELAEALGASPPESRDPSGIKRFDGPYRAIHRSVLSGLLGQVAMRTERATYLTAGNRELAVFPNSSLAEKRDPRRDEQKARRERRRDPTREAWIVAAEIVETSRVFARTVARIQPQWIEELGKHLCKRSYENPHWSADSARVTAHERVSLYGMCLSYRRIDYARVNPIEAREILVRSILVHEPELPEFPFLRENRLLCDSVASRLARVGRLNRQDLEERFVTFYTSRLPGIGSLDEFRRVVRERLEHSPHAFTLAPEEILEGEQLPDDEALYPSSLEIGGVQLPLHYRYAPGDTRDGVTLAIPLALARRIPARMLDGVIPGFRERQITYLLRALPKQIRHQIDSIPDAARTIADDPITAQRPLVDAIVELLASRYNVHIARELIQLDTLPDHLRPRIEIHSDAGVFESGRDLALLQTKLAEHERNHDHNHPTSASVWHETRAKWERERVESWDLGDLPEAIEVTTISGAPVYLHPALCCEEDRVALRLLDEKERASALSHLGINRLIERHLANEVRELTKQAREADPLKPLITLFTSPEELRAEIVRAALTHMLDREEQYPLRQSDFDQAIITARTRMTNLVRSIVTWAKAALEGRRQVLTVKIPYSGMREDLEALMPPNFLTVTPYEQLPHLARYLKAIVLRAERADRDRQRDAQRAQQLAPYLALIRPAPAAPTSKGSSTRTATAPQLPSSFRWMVEEFKVSLFAQELGTPYPISAKRLEGVLKGE